MKLEVLHHYVERLRKTVIGAPHFIVRNRGYEYGEQSAKVVAVLKIVRAAQGITTLEVLLRAGLLIDFGATVRCVYDAVAEAYFLMEEFPKTSANVDRFVKAFFESNLDGHVEAKNPVQSQKIRAAYVRAISGGQHHKMAVSADRIFKIFSGYVHANYAHTMEVYNGGEDDFNLGGVPSIAQRENRRPHLDYAADAVLSVAAYVARKLGEDKLFEEMRVVLIEHDKYLNPPDAA